MEERPDDLDEEQYRLVADKLYERLVSEHTRVSNGQLEIAKWMIASLLLINGAGIIAQAQSKLLDHWPLIISAPFFVLGVVTAILAGLGTWLHSAEVKKLLIYMIRSHFVANRTKWPEPKPDLERKIKLVSKISVAGGISSLVLFLIGCLASTATVALAHGKESPDASSKAELKLEIFNEGKLMSVRKASPIAGDTRSDITRNASAEKRSR